MYDRFFFYEIDKGTYCKKKTSPFLEPLYTFFCVNHL
jgi:hypothetical protein